MPNCQAIKTQLDSMIEERADVIAQLHEAHSPAQRSALLFELKSLNAAIAAKQKQYDDCVHPPLPKPDLLAKTFQIKPNHQAKTLEVAAVIQNIGDGPAQGPFQVTLGVTYTDPHLTVITRQLNIPVPATVRIEGHGAQFITDSIKNLPLLYRTDNPKFVYEFDMIVDSANQISEVSESNNVLSMRWWTVPPPA
jgi:CARDB